MKKVYLFAAMLAFSALTLTSCGGGETTTPTEPEAEPMVEETPAIEETPATIVLGDATHGEEIYNQVCMACHATGVAGAAKLDDIARWEASAAKGSETLKSNIIIGFTGEHGVMPAKGGRVDLTDEDMVDAMTYMFKTAGVDIQ